MARDIKEINNIELSKKYRGGEIKMFIKKEKYNNLIERMDRLEKKQIGEDELYKFYLERKLEEINSKLKHEISFEVKGIGMLTTAAIIKLGTKTIKEIHLTGLYIRPKKEVLCYLNSKNMRYFITIDKKLTRAEKEIDKMVESEQ